MILVIINLNLKKVAQNQLMKMVPNILFWHVENFIINTVGTPENVYDSVGMNVNVSIGIHPADEENAESPIDVTELGIVKLFNEKHD